MRPPWWQDFPPVEVAVECSGTRHRLRWDAGVLGAPDHADPEGERVLAAIGGARCACIDFLDRWARLADDLRVLTLASRGPGDQVGPSDEYEQLKQAFTSGGMPGAARAFPRRLPRRRAPQPGARHLFRSVAPASTASYSSSVAFTTGGPRRELDSLPGADYLEILSLDADLWVRLVETVLGTWAERVDDGDTAVQRARAALVAALYGRVTASLRDWTGDESLNVSVDMIDPNASPALVRTSDGLHAQLPFRWLSDVWARQWAVVLGRFSLCQIEGTDDKRRVLTINQDLKDIRPVTVSIAASSS